MNQPAKPYDNEKKFVLFTARSKDTEKSPDMTGNIQIDGIEYKLSAWWRTRQSNGVQYLSGSVKLKQPQQDGQKPPF